MAVQANWLEKDLSQCSEWPGRGQQEDQSRLRKWRVSSPNTTPGRSRRHRAVQERDGMTALVTRPSEPGDDEFGAPVAGAGRGTGRAEVGLVGGGDSACDGQAWTNFDSSTWTTVDPDDLDDLLSSMMGRSGRRSARTPSRGQNLEAVLDLELRGCRQRPHDRGDPQ